MRSIVLFALLCGACDTKSSSLGIDEIPLKIAQRCPGDPSCPDSGDGKLYVGASKRKTTPALEPFTDTNGNGFWDPGEAFTDENGNGTYDAYWLAGRDNALLATAVHDDLWARGWVVRQNQTTIAFVSVDLIGYFVDDVKATRVLLDPSWGIDLLVVSATHDHHAPDPIGQWGPDDSTRGVNDNYMAFLHQQIAGVVGECVAALKPAKMTAGSILTADGKDLTKYIGDGRDPTVIDPRMHVLQFDGADDGKPIVTVVNWASHPDSLGSQHRMVTSDYVNYMREEAELGTGDDVVFVNAAVGGQIGPSNVVVTDANGMTHTDGEHAYSFVEPWGRGVGDFVARALDPTQGDVITDAAPKISFRTTAFKIHVDNTRFQAAEQIGVFSRPFQDFDKHKPLIGNNAPQTDTEMSYIQLGDQVSLITMPGEIHPELWIGGYDSSDTYNYPFIDSTKPNPINLAVAPKAPYLRDIMDGNPNHRMVFGLSSDFLGYIVADCNFVLDPSLPYIDDAPGDHYEETNSVGARAQPEIVGTARQLVLDGRPNVAR